MPPPFQEQGLSSFIAVPALPRLLGRVGFSVLMSVLLAACAAVGPDYRRPELPAAPAYRGEGALAARPGSLPAPALDAWWAGFDDPALSGIVQQVLAQNLDLAAAAARVAQARAVAAQAGADQLPRGDASAQVTRERTSIESPLGKLTNGVLPDFERNQTFYNVGAGASWEADIFGELRRGTEAAGAEAQAAEADQLGVRIVVAAEAADAYFRIRGAQRRIALAQEQVDTDIRLRDLVQSRLRSGLASTREQAQAEALVYQARATIPPLRSELAIQLNRLDVLMAAAPGTYAAQLTGQPAQGGIPAISVAQGPAELLRRRPDVIAAERRLAASSARIGVAVAQYYPKFSLSALLGFDSLTSGNLFRSSAFQPSATAGLRWRLFDFGRVDAEVKQAEGANAEALLRYRNAMLHATEDVENAIVSLVQLEAQGGELDDEVAAHDRARAASEDAYKGGAVSLIEVLQEDRELLRARDDLARVRADQARAAVSTFRALGGGW
jgi:NodT family efflux transporter outer membrane factor (OMF) lipoprotein